MFGLSARLLKITKILLDGRKTKAWAIALVVLKAEGILAEATLTKKKMML